MNGRNRTSLEKPVISFADVKNKPIDRTHFFKSKTRFIYSYFSKALNELYTGIWSAFAFDHVDMNDLKQAMLPVVSSGALIFMGNYTTNRMSQMLHETDEYDFVYKFLFAFAVLSFSALNRVTEKKIKNNAAFSLAVASEVLAVMYLYYSTYQATEFLVKDVMSENYAMIAGLGASCLFVPGAAAHSVKQIQNHLVNREYIKGAQRSDTALISSGLTPISNTFFFAHYYLFSQMNLSRIFQLTAICRAMLLDMGLKKFRDIPPLGMDLFPDMMEEILKQQTRLDRDYQYNTTRHRVLRMTKQGPVFYRVPRYQLRYDDFVLCDNEMDFSSMPVSGEVVALEEKPDRLDTFPAAVSQKISTNLSALTGENNWIQGETDDVISSNKIVDMHAVRDGKQRGVLVGSKLNLFSEKNVFIRIMPEKERIASSTYQKKSVIAEIITERKKKTVISSVLLSIIMGGLVSLNDVTFFPEASLRLMFHVFQMMIPFSEILLTQISMIQLTKELKSRLNQTPMDMKNILCNIDLCNAMGGYYDNLFPSGVAFVSDKTGTLTTSHMEIVGIWTARNSELKNSTITKAELFSWIFTHQEKELEPEEFSMKEFFAEELGNPEFLKIETRGTNHFIKHIQIADETIDAETWHIGLYGRAGGRFTLVKKDETYYLAFCGVPNKTLFESTPLGKAYYEMEPRKGVLSRDWCIAHMPISPEQFLQLKNAFDNDNKKIIEEALFNTKNFLALLHHDFTCCINNPVKPDAEKIVERLQKRTVLWIIATGDTPGACFNINDILCPFNAKKAKSFNQKNIQELDDFKLTRDMTIIFCGINDEILSRFKQILACHPDNRPVVIFAEMSTEGKGLLVDFLKENGFYVAYNGDGPNDTRGMAKANFVIGHTTSKGTFAPGVEQYVDLSDRQLQKILQSNHSFYELFDIHKADSAYAKTFAKMSNSLEKSFMSLVIKGGFKMSFEFMKALGFAVTEMSYFHPLSMAFDVIYFTIATKEIIESADRPMDNKNLCASDFPLKLQLGALAFAMLQSFSLYALRGESTNIYCMVSMLAALPLILKSLFSAFGHVQEEEMNKKLVEVKKPDGCDPRLFGQKVVSCEAQIVPQTLRSFSAPF